MRFQAEPSSVQVIKPFREIYRNEMACQIIHDSLHSRPGWTHEYLLHADGAVAGYASIAVGGPWKDKPAVFEFFVLPPFRKYVFELFSTFLNACGASQIDTQSNDQHLTVMLHTFCTDIVTESILYEDRFTTSLAPPGATFRNPTADDKLNDLTVDQFASHGIVEVDGQRAGFGGILFHYNRPYGDIYMEIAEPFRKRGLGSYLVQELKKLAYQLGNVPSARCNPRNIASRKTLQKAGFVPCGNILVGTVRK